MADYNTNYEYQKRIPIAPTTMTNIVKNHGYYDINSNWNSIVKVVGYDDMVFRARVEVLVIKDDCVFMTMNSTNPSMHYRIPGGSLEKSVSNIDQAQREVLEETKMIVKNLQYTGENYVRIFKNRSKNQEKTRRVAWDGTYTEIFVAEFDKYYKGRINETVYDSNMHKTGHFYEIRYIKNILIPQHYKILKKMNLL